MEFYFGPASATQPGVVTTGAQTLAGAKTFTGAMVINQTAIAGAETPLTIGSSDDAVGKLLFRSESAVTATFLPGIKGTSPNASAGITITGAPTTDDGSAACIVLNAATAAGGTITGNTLFKLTNNGAQRVLIDKSGNISAVGALTSTGASTFSTSVAVGAGTAITKIVAYSQVITPASVAANTTAEQTFTVTGLTTADKVTINPGATPTAGTGIVGVRVSAVDTLAVTYLNATAGALTPVSSTCLILATRS